MLGSKGHSDWRRRFPTVVEELGGIDDLLVIHAAKELETKGRVSNELGIRLLLEADLTDLRLLGKALKMARFEEEVYFNSNLRVNPTNICVLACRFCAFRRGRKADDNSRRRCVYFD